MDDREHTNPVAYVMNKHQHSGTGSGPFGSSIYDDTGRGKNRTKPYLLEEARRVIERERRKQEKIQALEDKKKGQGGGISATGTSK